MLTSWSAELVNLLCYGAKGMKAVNQLTLKWKHYPGLSRWAPCYYHKSFECGGGSRSQCQSDDMWGRLAIAGVEGGRDRQPRNAAASRSWKRRGNRLSPRLKEGTRTCWHLDFCPLRPILDFPGGASDKELVYQCRRSKRRRFDPWVGKIPWRRAWQPTPGFLPGESHGQRILMGYSLWGCRVRHDWSSLAHMHKTHFGLLAFQIVDSYVTLNH